MENLIIPVDRARRVVLGTRIRVIEQISGRIAAGITLVVFEVPEEKISILDFLGLQFELWKI
jgi:hypothetical protein